jgi:serine/threonine-protein kinase ULK/ATG1
MPKAVDVYVLESKIGAGQFGDVYRGYSKVDGRDVAVKTIRRDKIKGKDRPR